MTSTIIPEWVKDAVFYQIFPDRFAKSARVPKPSNLEPWDSPPTHFGFKGGDLLGVAEHLDYLENLGINAIYFNPIFQSAANHRYHTHDYYRVDPILGGNETFHELLNAAHARNIRVVLDGVFNHASRGFYQFHHALENGAASPYLDWFYFDEERLQAGEPLDAYPSPQKLDHLRHTQHSLQELGYQAWWNLPPLPKLNAETEAVRRFIFDVARHWIQFGADGWRLDVPGEIDDDQFWREFRRVVKTANPEAYIVGEIWHDATRWLQGDQFDAVMNYILNRACLGFFGGERLDTTQHPGGYMLQPLSATQFADALDDMLALYDWEVTLAQLNLLSSHDMPRFLTLVREDKAALKLATLFQMTFPGAPCIYYGDEIGMEGRHDPDCRRAFPWDETCWDHDLLAFFRRAIRLRRERPALRQGRYLRLHADDQHGVYAFARQGEEETLVVVLNNGPDDYDLDVPVRDLFTAGTALHDLWEGGRAQVAAGRIVGSTLPPRSGAVLGYD
ncbi:MAG: alpha-amylase family glycosyl hydrolase [Chloroflexota bacterium]|nr:alpha-amylase family glycosyl hydrolase [Chloroflexota bacterium]